ncbi:MAG: esterase family protein [Muribaculaceae bacterium]|nr:esterase family protein [Muribaculaceae bacterium]
MKTILKLQIVLAIAAMCFATSNAQKVTPPVPEIYDQAIANAEKKLGIVDTIEVMSNKMGRAIKNTVVLPAQYSQKDYRYMSFPVIYLLHGAWGSYCDWPKKADLRSLASQYSIIFVCPDGQDSWYFDSPIDPTFQFETFITQELRSYIESHYRTLNHPKYRAITGLSMGGHGALWLAWRHPEIYGSCGSMSGGVDIYNFPNKWKINERLGDYESNKEVWREHSVMNLVSTLVPGQNIIIDDGNKDIFINENNALHEALDKQGIPHDYIVRPGAHNWSYWVNALDYQVLFFHKAFNSGLK